MIVLASTLAITGAAFAAENNAKSGSAMEKAGTVTGVGSSLSESKAAGPMRSSTDPSGSPSTTGTAPSKQMDSKGSGTMGSGTAR